MARQSQRSNITDFFFKPVIPNGGEGQKIFFEAHILGISDSTSPQWDSKMDMGRAEPTYMYQSTQRTVSISFALFAMNSIEYVDNYDNLKKLKNMTLPIYRAGQRYNAPHTIFKVGNLLHGYGILNNVDSDFPADVVWIRERPIYIEVNLSMTILANSSGKRPSYDNGNYDYWGA